MRLQPTHWLLADQAVVSGCNFLVGLLLARFLGVHGFGQWTLVLGVVLYINTIAGALIWLPMLTIVPSMGEPDDGRRFILGALACQLQLAGVLAALVGAGAWLMSSLEPEWFNERLVLGLVGVSLAFQLQEWVRRACFAVRHAAPAFWMDLLTYGGQVLCVCALQQAGMLDIGSALLGIAMAYLAGFVLGLLFTRWRPDWSGWRLAWRKLLAMGRSYLFGEQTQWVGTAGLLYVAAHLVGPQAAGAVRAVQGLLGPTNVLFQAFNNLVQPQSAAAHLTGGRPALNALLMKVGWQFGVPLGLGLLVLSVMGNEAMALAFGSDYARYGGLVGWQCAQVALTFVWLLFMCKVRTVGRPAHIFLSGSVQAGVSVGAVLLLAPVFAESGVLVASGLGLLAALVVLWKC